MNKHMQKWSLFRVICVTGWLLAGLLLPHLTVRAAASDLTASDAQLVVKASSQQAIVLELTVNHYTLETVSEQGESFQRVDIAGLEQVGTPGSPETPSRGALLGVPTTAGVRVQIVDAVYETVAGLHLLPAPQLVRTNDDLDEMSASTVSETFALDTARYATDAFLPEATVKLGEVGYLREQPVAQVQFYPVQYNPVRQEARIYRRILVQVTWDTTVQAADVNRRGVSPTYEAILQHELLNYATLARPAAGARVMASVVSTPTQAASSHGASVLKIGIEADGLYKLTYTDLVNAGFNPAGIDPRMLKLTNHGNEVAIDVPGEADGIFDSTDFIVFYGQAMHDPYTKRNVYWLSGGPSPGRRMAQHGSASLSNSALPDHFPATLHAEEDTVYWQAMPGQGEDRWFWDTRLSPNTKGMPSARSYSVVLPPISAAGTATIRVRLKGYTSLGHRTRIAVNGHVVDDQTWNGQLQFTHQTTFPQAFLQSGANLILVETVASGAPVDQLLVNWIEFDYLGDYRADNDQLVFGAPTPGVVQFGVDSFTSPAVSVFEISDPANPAQLRNATVVNQGNRYAVHFVDTAGVNSRYLALTAAQFKVPVSVTLDQPSTWKSPDNSADYIIITYDDFYPAALALADHRRATGLRTVVVKVSDVYDEFNDGIFNPRAIQAFLAYAYQNWQAPAPTYVVLLGDANQDYKDNLKTSTPNYVPSQNIESDLFGEVSSDDGFAAVSGNDTLPDLLIGRLVAQSSQEANAIVSKIIGYDQNPPDASWNKNVLLVADDDESIFKNISEDLATRLPYYYTINRVYMGQYPPGNPTTEIVNQINQGAILVNYAGHGKYFGWGQWDQNRKTIFEVADATRLNNANKLPVITVANCLNGFFAGPKNSPALAEVLQRQINGGAIAIWAPTSLEYPTGHGILLSQFYDAIFKDDLQALGAATTSAKLKTFAQNSFWGELTETYVLFGDPATSLGIPPNYPYIKRTMPANGVVDVPLDQPIQISFNKSMAPNSVALGGASIANLTFTPAWNTDFTQVSFSAAGFTHGQTYQFALTGQDRQNNQLGAGLAPNPWSFTVTQDDTPPSGNIVIQGAEPGSVLTTVVIDIAFTEPVRAGSITYSISPLVQSSFRLSNDGRSARWEHARLQVGTTYTLTVLTAKDRAGNALQTPFQGSFTVGETLYTYLPIIAVQH